MRAQIITPMLGHRMGRWMAPCSLEFIHGYIGSKESNLIRGSSCLRPHGEEEVSDQKHCSFTLWLCLPCHTTLVRGRIFLSEMSLAVGHPDTTLQCIESAVGWGESWSWFHGFTRMFRFMCLSCIWGLYMQNAFEQLSHSTEIFISVF